MGMDISGRKPVNEKGEYFRNSVWSWRPLAIYIERVAPDIYARCKYWQSNDGDGLKAADSLALAERLQAEIDAGRTEHYARIWESEQEQAPDDPCWCCEGTGTRKPPPDTGAGNPKNGGIKCNACNGEGHIRPFATYYPFQVENVEAFVAFLRGCGGFNIY